MILNICDITHYSITLFKNLLYKDIQLYYKGCLCNDWYFKY